MFSNTDTILNLTKALVNFNFMQKIWIFFYMKLEKAMVDCLKFICNITECDHIGVAF